MRSKFKIAILGLGGVGGYIGEKLAAHYAASNEIEIDFIARGENGRIIKEDGLKLITPQGELIAHPSFITGQPEELGLVDLIICCVKNYDLETSIESLKPCIKKDTIILPFLNGVDASERIRKIIPQAEIWDGCVYILSRLMAPGIVKQSAGLNQFYFGSAKASKEKLKRIETILKEAGINAFLSENISETIWEKFFFISMIATLTSYFDLGIGYIINNHEGRELLLNLLSELKAVADAKQISLPNNIIQKTLDKIFSLPYETLSSMHSDFKRGGQTEVDSLTGYTVKAGMETGIPTPNYERIWKGLLEKLQPQTAAI